MVFYTRFTCEIPDGIGISHDRETAGFIYSCFIGNRESGILKIGSRDLAASATLPLLLRICFLKIILLTRKHVKYLVTHFQGIIVLLRIFY